MMQYILMLEKLNEGQVLWSIYSINIDGGWFTTLFCQHFMFKGDTFNMVTAKEFYFSEYACLSP